MRTGNNHTMTIYVCFERLQLFEWQRGTTYLETSRSVIFIAFLEKLGFVPKQFRGFLMDNLTKVEDVVKLNIFIYDIDIEKGDFVGELVRRNIGKHENTI